MSGTNKTLEKNLWKWWKGGVEKHFKTAPAVFGTRSLFEPERLHWQRVENSTRKGTLDVEGCYIGSCFIVELKSVERPKQSKTPINTKLTTAQAMFLRARHIAGGKAWLLIEVGGTARYLVSARHAVECAKPIRESRLRALAEWAEEPFDVLLAVIGK